MDEERNPDFGLIGAGPSMAMRLWLDEALLGTVSTSGQATLCLQMTASLDAGSLVDLDLHSLPGTLDATGEALFWLPELQLRAGQGLRVEWVADEPSTLQGRTLEELYPDDDEDPAGEQAPSEPPASTLRAHYQDSGGADEALQSRPGERQLMLQASWEPWRPGQLIVSLLAGDFDTDEAPSDEGAALRECLYRELEVGHSFCLRFEPPTPSA